METKLLDPVPYGNTRFEVQRDLGRGLAKRVAVFDSIDDAQEYVRRFNKSKKTKSTVNISGDSQTARGE